MATETYFLTKTSVPTGALLMQGRAAAVEQHESLSRVLESHAGIEASALFAEPIIGSSGTAEEITVSWYSAYSGDGVRLSDLGGEARQTAERTLRSQLAAVAELLRDPDFGPLVGAALHVYSINAVWVVEGHPVLVDWAMLPAEAAGSPEARERHFRATLGQYLPLDSAPPTSQEEWKGRGYVAAAAGAAAAGAMAVGAAGARETSGVTEPGDNTGEGADDATANTDGMATATNASHGRLAAGTAGTAQTVGVVPIHAHGGVRWIWVAPAVLLVLLVIGLLWLLWPGTLLYPGPTASASVIHISAVLDAQRDANRVLETRIAQLRQSLEGAICTPQGQLVLPNGMTPYGWLLSSIDAQRQAGVRDVPPMGTGTPPSSRSGSLPQPAPLSGDASLARPVSPSAGRSSPRSTLSTGDESTVTPPPSAGGAPSEQSVPPAGRGSTSLPTAPPGDGSTTSTSPSAAAGFPSQSTPPGSAPPLQSTPSPGDESTVTSPQSSRGQPSDQSVRSSGGGPSAQASQPSNAGLPDQPTSASDEEPSAQPGSPSANAAPAPSGSPSRGAAQSRSVAPPEPTQAPSATVPERWLTQDKNVSQSRDPRPSAHGQQSSSPLQPGADSPSQRNPRPHSAPQSRNGSPPQPRPQSRRGAPLDPDSQGQPRAEAAAPPRSQGKPQPRSRTQSQSRAPSNAGDRGQAATPTATPRQSRSGSRSASAEQSRNGSPSRSAPQPGSLPDPSAIDEERWRAQDISLLEGCWQLETDYSLANVDTNEVYTVPEWEMCFDGAGNGNERFKVSNGVSCSAPVTALFLDSGKLLVGEGRDVECTNGWRVFARKIVCSLDERHHAVCDSYQMQTDSHSNVSFHR